MIWQDNLLTWETVNSTITSLILPANYIWTPDIMIGNSANTDNQLDTAQSKAFVHNRPYNHHRRALTHVVNSLLPVICLSLLNSFVFILPADGGERTGVSISLLLSYAIYMTYIKQTLPSNSDTLSYFSIYLVCLICKSSLIAMATTISLWLHDKNKAQAVAWSPFTRTPSPKIIPEDQLMRTKTSAMKLQDMNSFGDDKFEQDSKLNNTKVDCTSHGARQPNEWSVRAIKFDWFCCIFFISCSLLMPTVCIALMLT
ncbi:acetylcholine receptor subunit alpha-type unc-38 [Patella vulgata]|uniref:acetylcholine receptor subunit alpha-type unc-38 n=1 Tax=Patella vulgata TaxID=6465 RepID=UPI0024A8D452|nr:acetylcholine receptor subunit alpha-type unc-38 [Patella vulgata]